MLLNCTFWNAEKNLCYVNFTLIKKKKAGQIAKHQPLLTMSIISFPTLTLPCPQAQTSTNGCAQITNREWLPPNITLCHYGGALPDPRG